MSLLEILKLVGFATGAALHLYIAWLIWNRRLGSRQRLTQPERTFLALGLCLGVWFLGNLLTTLHVLLLPGNGLTVGLRIWDTVTMTGIGSSTGGLPISFVLVALPTTATTAGWVSMTFGDGYAIAGDLISGAISVDQ